MIEMKYPLEGFKVVELSTVIATPVTARLLADFGATVIKVENYPNGDLLRPTGKGHNLPTRVDCNPLFDMYNAGKKLISVDLKKPEGMEIFFKLLEQADIFVTNVRMQSLEKMQIDYNSLKEKFPRLIYGHFSGFGLRGEEVNRPGFDTTVFWMRSGASVDIGTPGAFPVRPSFGFGDIATASGFVAALLMAVIGREKTGTGTLVSTCLQKSAIWCNATSVINAQPHYGKTYPVERYLPWDPFSDYYCCKDGEWIAFMEKVYAKDRYIFAKIFDMPELVEDENLNSLDSMRDSGKLPEVTEKIQQKMLMKTSMEWKTIFDQYDVANEIGRHFKDVYKDEQARANNAFDDVEYPDGTVTAMPAPPFEFSEYGRHAFRKTGDVGRDTFEVLPMMGYSEERISLLKEQNVVK